MPSTKEFAAHLVDQQLRSHGFVSLKGITYLRRNPGLRQAVKALVNEKLAQGLLEEVQVSSGETFVLETGAFERPMPRRSNRMVILSPFDNCVIQRDRLKAVFQFDYQIECYVPEAKRKYGYFCLPLLYCDKFIGRMDCKAYRPSKQLEIKSLHFEKHDFDSDALIAAFTVAIKKFAVFQKCDSVALVKVQPAYLAQAFRNALQTIFH